MKPFSSFGCASHSILTFSFLAALKVLDQKQTRIWSCRLKHQFNPKPWSCHHRVSLWGLCSFGDAAALYLLEIWPKSSNIRFTQPQHSNPHELGRLDLLLFYFKYLAGPWVFLGDGEERRGRYLWRTQERLLSHVAHSLYLPAARSALLQASLKEIHPILGNAAAVPCFFSLADGHFYCVSLII